MCVCEIVNILGFVDHVMSVALQLFSSVIFKQWEPLTINVAVF